MPKVIRYKRLLYHYLSSLRKQISRLNRNINSSPSPCTEKLGRGNASTKKGATHGKKD